MMKTSLLLILPILLPLVTATVCVFSRGHPKLQAIISVSGMGALLTASIVLLSRLENHGILVAQMGGWPAPYGITLVGDHLSLLMVVISAVVGLAGVIYSFGDVDAERMRRGFHTFLHVMIGGVCGCFLAGDLFNMYVWFEVLLLASFVLMAIGNTRPQLEGTVKYAVLNLVASIFLLAGVGMIYGITGTLNLADLAVHLRETENPHLVTAVSSMFIVAIGLKASMFPFFFWLPASYHTPPVTVSAIFSGVLTKVGVYVLIRLFTLLFVVEVEFTHTLLLWMSGITMLVGVLGAAVQNELRRILSFHIISQIGYMIMGLALLTPFALVGAIYFIIHNILAKTNLFFVSGIANLIGGSFDVRRLGGLYRREPLLAALFLIPALALAGIPPLSGFWGKLILARAGFDVQEYAVVAVALVVGLLTLYSMTKIWFNAFLAPPSENPAPNGTVGRIPRGRRLAVLYIPVVLLAVLTAAISLFPAPLVDFSSRAAGELLNADLYIDAVLNP